MVRYAGSRFGWDWLREAAEAFFEKPGFLPEYPQTQLFMPWAVHHWEVEGRPVREWFLEEKGTTLPEAERMWLLSQRPVVVTVWEVLEVRKGVGVRVTDLLGRGAHFVYEVRGSQQLLPRHAVLGRVVEHEGLAVFCGIDPQPLPPLDADEVVRVARKLLGVRGNRSVPRELLASEDTSLGLVLLWHGVADGLRAKAKQEPRLTNTDGEPLVFVVDLYAFAPEAHSRVLEALSTLEGMEVEEEGEVFRCTFLKEGNAMHAGWENTIIGSAEVGADSLRLEANSVERADALGRRVEAACDGLVRHRSREKTEPSKVREGRAGQRPPPSPEEQESLREFKARHYAAWLDSQLPALKGKSPRQAVRTKAGRHQVDVLLKQLENLEANRSVEERMDVSGLRRELGLEG
ncbi:Hypothetical protein AA314_00206 [Archangium gephyra]|nr:Hypothetical protein AA314_00206 [Archangium gephyra]